MTHVAVQRVVVRMLYDPAFAGEVYASPERALAGLPIDEAERRWLVAPDPRAYRADPFRRARSLKALIEEFAASSALVVRADGGAAGLDAFFSSGVFHLCIQERGSMARAFGLFLEARPEPWVRAFARLERALARVRRASAPGAPRPALPPPGPPADLVLSPRADVATLPGGTLSHWQSLAERLRAAPDPVSAVLDRAVDLPDTLVVPAAPRAAGAPADPERLLVDGTGPSIAIEHAPAPLAALLEAARAPAARSALESEARRHGADPGDDAAIVDDLLAQGLLVSAR